MIIKKLQNVKLGYEYTDRNGDKWVVYDIFYDTVRLLNKTTEKRIETNAVSITKILKRKIFKLTGVDPCYYFPLSIGDDLILENSTIDYEKGDVLNIYEVSRHTGNIVVITSDGEMGFLSEYEIPEIHNDVKLMFMMNEF